MGVPRQEIGLAAIGETLYAVGGFAGPAPSAAVEAYDTRTDRWSSVAPLPEPLHHVMVASVDGVVYAAGGLGTAAPSGASDATWAFEPAAGVWTPRAPLPQPRGAGAAGVIAGRIYVVGGLRGSSVDDLTVYDPSTDAWTTLASMPTARDHLAAGVVDGRLYAVGGRAGGQLFSVVEAFDPTTGTWSGDRARMPTARGGLGAAVLNGLLYAVGGEGNAASPLGTFPQAEAYDPAADAWTRLPDMGVPRHGLGVAGVGGALWVMGGASRQGLGPSGASEVLIPGTGDVLDVRRLSASRGRLRLRGRLRAPGDVDPAAASVRLELDGVPIASLPPGSLVASPRGTRWHFRSPTFRRLVLRRVRGGDLGLRLVVAATALPEPGRAVTVGFVLDQRAFCGTAGVRGRQPRSADERRR
jgi:N-acetylneuraminic acid mutarotase